jgi:hypothetical protein
MRKQYHSRPINGDIYIWDVHKLVKKSKNFEVKEFPLDDIRELDENFWYQQKTDIPTCRSFVDHMKLVEETDLKYPIILSQDGGVMDGMHRVCKALLLRQKTIKAVQFETNPEPDYKNMNLDDLPYDD